MTTIHRKTLAVGLMTIGLASIACDSATEPDDNVEPVDSTSISLIGHGFVNERYTAEVAAFGDYAYTTSWQFRGPGRGNAVKTWDVSGPNPLLVDSIIVDDVTDNTSDVQISDDGRWLVVSTEYTNGSIVVYDLVNPAKPQFVSRHMTANTNGGVHTVKLGRVNGALYAFLSVNRDATRGPQLVIVDLSSPATPHEVLARPMGNPFLHDVFVRDGLLFTALWNDGMTIWDIGGGGRGGSPANPVQISNIRTVGVNPSAPSVHNMWWFHNPEGAEKRYVFVGEEATGFVIGASSAGDVHVVDISDIAQPREVAFFPVAGAGAHNFTMDEASGILYAAFYNGGVRAIDVRGDLGSCPQEQRSTDGRCDLGKMGRGVAAALHNIGQVSIWGVARVGSFVYASDMLSGIFKLDVSELIR